MDATSKSHYTSSSADHERAARETPFGPQFMSLKRAFMEVVSGPGQGRRILLRNEQVRYVGRTEQADVSFPENPELSSVHFSIKWFGDQCEIKDLHSANGTFRGGKKITEALLRPGEEIKAGKALFRLVIEDEFGDSQAGRGDTVLDAHRQVDEPAPSPRRHDTTVVSAPLPAEKGLAIRSAAVVVQVAPLADAAKAMLIEDMPVFAYLDLLASREQFLDALRVVAYALTKRSAVDWSCRCIRLAQGEDLSPVDSAALAAAETWIAEPSEENRRKAGAAAEASGHTTPASWAATAAFWNSGSLAPPSAPVVPPGETLTAHAASGAVMLAAVAKQPDKANGKYLEFLRIGRELAADQSGA
jgi:hypothetical protein